MSESLFLIEQTLQDLMDERALAELDGDVAAVAAMDKCISEYLTKEAAKVTSYVNLIRSRKMTAQACDQEIERLKAIREAAKRDVDKLKQNAMEVMNRFGVRELKAKPGGGLRIQGNGGIEPVDIPEWPKDSSGDLKLRLWCLPEEIKESEYFDFPMKIFVVPDTDAIRAALSQRVVCPECTGKGIVENEAACIAGDLQQECPCCQGSGTIPATVPGARLLERGEHVRVS